MNLQENKNYNEKGFTLIEVIISASLLALALSALVPVFVSMTKYNTEMELKTKAIATGQNFLETIREKDHSTIPTSGNDEETYMIDGTELRVKTTYCRSSAFCIGLNRHISLEITHKNDLIHEIETVFTKLN